MRENYEGIRIGINGKCLLMGAIFIFFFLLFMPLWQIGVNHTLEESVRSQERMIQTLQEEERMIRTEIATLRETEKMDTILASVRESDKNGIAALR